MNKTSNKKLYWLLPAGIISGILLLCFFYFFPSGKEPYLTVVNLNVGKADAAVIMTEGHTGMIDTGLAESFDTIDAFLKENSIDTLDFLLLTHYDKDHIGSAVSVLKNYKVKTLYLPDYESGKALYPEVMENKELAEEPVFVDEKLSFSLEKVKADILPAPDPEALLEDDKNTDNDMSLVLMLTCGNKKLLFTGDVENARMEQMLEDPYDLSCDWVKIPHHGNYDKKVKKLLKASGAEYAIVSTSAEVLDDRLLDVLAEKDLKTFYTFEGNVKTLVSDKSIEVSYAKPYTRERNYSKRNK